MKPGLAALSIHSGAPIIPALSLVATSSSTGPTGSLGITSDLVGNAETLRQSVIELCQLMNWAHQRGSQRIAQLGTS